MTTKRFVDGGEECIEDQFLIDTSDDKYYWVSNGLDDIVTLLNELHEENEYLCEKIKENEWHWNTIDEDRDVWRYKCKRLEEENEQLKHRLAISEKANFVTALEKENEQLKTQLKDCEKRVTDKEVEWLRENTVWEQMPSNKKTFTSTSVKEDLE